MVTEVNVTLSTDPVRVSSPASAPIPFALLVTEGEARVRFETLPESALKKPFTVGALVIVKLLIVLLLPSKVPEKGVLLEAIPDAHVHPARLMSAVSLYDADFEALALSFNHINFDAVSIS